MGESFREGIVRLARSYQGTPYRHQGRQPGPAGGLDCCGVIVCAAVGAGARLEERPDYPAICPERGILDATLPTFADRHHPDLEGERLLAHAIPGDVMLFEIKRDAAAGSAHWFHLGLATGPGWMVHCQRDYPVREVMLDKHYRRMLGQLWTIREP